MSPVTDRPARFDTSDSEQREEGLASASLAVRRGELVIIPTDTVYGIGADAFDAKAVQRLLDAKGRGRDMPPPVLVSSMTTMDALAVDIPDWARSLTDRFWPGPLTLVLKQQPSLQWDLGDTRGTVAIRMPDHEVATDLIQRTGPLAVSSANNTGMAAALDADEAVTMLGDEVTCVLDAGRTPGEKASTIIDCTTGEPVVLREGALGWHLLNAVLDEIGHPLDGSGAQKEEQEQEDDAPADDVTAEAATPDEAEPEDDKPGA